MGKLFVTVLVAMLAAAGLAGCGGDDDDTSSPTADATEGETEVTEATEEDTESDAGEESGDEGDEALGGASEELEELLAQQSSARIKITYETSDQDGASTAMTIAQDGEGTQSILTDGTLIITSGDSTISCDGYDTPDVTCTELPSGMGDFAMLGLTMFTAIGEGLLQAGDEAEGVELFDDEVAGRNARCAEYASSAILDGLGELVDEDVPEDATVRVCVDTETGFLLEFTGEGDNQFGSIIATEVGEPSDSDFEAPVTPEATPDLGELPDVGDIEDLIEENT